MNGQAALSTGFVHLLGGILTLMPLGHRPPAARVSTGDLEMPVEVEAPALALIAESGQPGSADGFGPSLSEGRGCPVSSFVDTDAEPDFPLIGGGRPFQRVTGARWSPVFCARIGFNGRIVELHLAGQSGGSGSTAADRATANELARLRFRPARREGRPVEAWHRILVNLPGTVLDPTTDHPTACLMPGGTRPCEQELMIPT